MKKIILLGLLLTNFVQATNGVFAINDVCAALGCFPGDTAGYPVTITNSGSYQLTSNLVSASTTTNVIELNTNNLSVDLNGFAILGPRTCTGNNATLSCSNPGMTAQGIGTDGTGRLNITIKNGVVKGFETGVAFNGAGRNIAISNITAEANDYGISLNGTGIISNCIANRNVVTALTGGFSLVLINDTVAFGNKGGPVFIGGGVCSNVFFTNNGSTSNLCARYTNGSTCEGTVACP